MRTWQSGTKRLELAVEDDADVAVRDQAVRAGGGSRGELGAIILRPMGACIFLLCTRWGVGATSREANLLLMKLRGDPAYQELLGNFTSHKAKRASAVKQPQAQGGRRRERRPCAQGRLRGAAKGGGAIRRAERKRQCQSRSGTNWRTNWRAERKPR